MIAPIYSGDKQVSIPDGEVRVREDLHINTTNNSWVWSSLSRKHSYPAQLDPVRFIQTNSGEL